MYKDFIQKKQTKKVNSKVVSREKIQEIILNSIDSDYYKHALVQLATNCKATELNQAKVSLNTQDKTIIVNFKDNKKGQLDTSIELFPCDLATKQLYNCTSKEKDNQLILKSINIDKFRRQVRELRESAEVKVI
jgi:hypothetical protein